MDNVDTMRSIPASQCEGEAVQVRQEIRCQHQHQSAQEQNNTLVA